MLIESPSLDRDINRNWVRKAFHEPEKFTEHEFIVVADIVERLRPYAPKRHKPTQGRTTPPTPSAAPMCGIVLIANTLLRVTGYPEFTRRIAPVPSAGSLHPIPLGAAALYECLCAKSPGHFDPFYDPINKITSLPAATHHRDEIFASLFDMNSIMIMCAQRKLTVAQQ